MPKLIVKFYPESDKPEYIQAAQEYQQIWDTDGEMITEVIEKVSCIKFQDNSISVLIFEGMSGSFPMRLRASYPLHIKKGTLVHELCHRITNGITVKDMNLEAHKLINLILYDIWIELYGEEFAKKNMEAESGRQPFYKEAWDWALAIKDKKERLIKFKEICQHLGQL